MYHLDGNDEWNHIHPEDLWVYNKLFLSRMLGYTCGPVGTTVFKPDFYIVRPSFNLLGMGRFARKEWIEKHTDNIHPAEFWCEIFEGEPLYKWKKWQKIDKDISFPDILNNLVGNYEWINCEFIGENLIEVHFRRNPDFRYGNSVAIPVWDDKKIKNMKFIEDNDYHRKGFYIK